MSAVVADLLDRAADLIEPEGAWTQGTGARDAEGISVTLLNETAVCWCAMGALGTIRATDDNNNWVDDDGSFKTAIKAVELLVGQTVIAWNDDPARTQADVVAVFREAARRERARS